MNFGARLRPAADPSRAEAARRARAPVSMLRNWENDRSFPPLSALLRLVGALGVPVERLAEGVETPGGDEPGSAVEKPRRMCKGNRADTGEE